MATNKIEQILSLVSELTVLELSDCIKKFESHFGVSAAMPVATGVQANASADTAGASAKEEKSEYKVTLKESGSEKIKVIKALRKLLPDLNLGDAKNAVENPPYLVAESAAKDVAATMKRELEEAGAKVELA